MFMAIATPLTARYGINEQVISIDEGNNVFMPPQDIAWFGTDDIDRDMYTRLLYGIRTSMFIGIASVALNGCVNETTAPSVLSACTAAAAPLREAARRAILNGDPGSECFVPIPLPAYPSSSAGQ